MNLIFVGGIPRSGTTMVQNILDSHSEIYGGAEFDRLPNIMRLHTEMSKSIANGRIVDYTTQENLDNATRQFISDVLVKTVVSDSEKALSYISEKTPWNILSFPELVKLYPQAKFIYVLRNPVDTVSSMRQVANRALAKGIAPPDFTENIYVAANYIEGVCDILSFMNKSYPGQVFTVKFEELVNDLESNARALFTYLGLSWEENVLNYKSIKHPGEEQMTKDNIWYTKDMYQGNSNVKNTNPLDKTETAFLTELLKDNEYLKSYGYNFETNGVLGSMKAKAMKRTYYRHYKSTGFPKRYLS